MKSTELKKMIKEAVKEAIQEELKDILLEAVRSPKTVVSENVSMPTSPGPFIPRSYRYSKWYTTRWRIRNGSNNGSFKY
jgi:hypothetical protein